MALREQELPVDDEVAARVARFAALVERQSRFVFRVAYAVLRNTEDAEDAVQETFLKLYRSGAWERVANERAFLARVAWRISVGRLPRRTGTSVNEPLSSASNPEDAAIAADWSVAVHRLIDTLPEELRQPLALSTVEEMSSHEIAEVMGIAEGTVRTRLMRARQVLRKKLSALMGGRYER
jgi:RNA polymerase sigma-70 factor (ECF subfamily)